MDIPQHLQYTSEHLWVKAEGDQWLAGITSYAQNLLGDIVFVDAPSVRTSLSINQTCGLVESVKTGSDLYAPLSGVVVASNESLRDHPEQINDAPYDTWIFKFQAAPDADLSVLLNAEQYQRLIQD